jgi:hypothetical protein
VYCTTALVLYIAIEDSTLLVCHQVKRTRKKTPCTYRYIHQREREKLMAYETAARKEKKRTKK